MSEYIQPENVQGVLEADVGTSIQQSSIAAEGAGNAFVPLQKKTIYEKSGVNAVFALLAVVLGYLLVKIGVYGTLGLGMTIWTVLLVGLTAAWLKVKKLKINRAGVGYFSLMAPIGLYFLLSDNTVLKSLALFLLPVIYTYAVYTAVGRRETNRLDGHFFRDMSAALFTFPFTGFPASPIILAGGLRKVRNVKKVWYFLLGMLIMLPLLYLVLSMLSFDSAFSNLLSALPDFWRIDKAEILKWFVGILLSFFLFGFLYQLIHKKQDSSVKNALLYDIVPGSLALGAVIPLLLIYVLFFFSQLTYFVSAFSGILPVEFTYAEYARKGFFELCTVSGINAFVLILLFLLTKRESQGHMAFRISMTLLSLCSAVLIVISLQKMLMYITVYSLTPLRVYTSWFMLFLMICFLAAMGKIWMPKLNVMKILVLSLVSMFLILCYADSDRLIASYNAGQYEAGISASLDEDTLRKLGASATSELIRVQKESYSEVVEEELLRREKFGSRDLWDFNLAAWQAENDLEAYWRDTEVLS